MTAPEAAVGPADKGAADKGVADKTVADRGVARRRGPADPVRALMHRHRAMCARATHPLEIAALLEAQGMTDRSAADYRHRDVFALAEELFARVPRAHEPEPVGPEPGPADRRHRRVRTVLRGALHLAPGLCCLAGTVVLQTRPWDGPVVAAVIASAALGAGAALWACLRRGPLRTAEGAPSALSTSSARPSWQRLWPWTAWLLAFLFLGEWALDAVLSVVTGSPVPPVAAVRTSGPATLTALAFAVAPAAWCASWFARRCRGTLSEAVSLRAFTTAVRPLVSRVCVIFLGALLALLALLTVAVADPASEGWDDPLDPAAPASLGLLLFVSRLLGLHGRTTAAAAGPAAACVLQAAALGTVALGGVTARSGEAVAAGFPALLAAHPAAVQALPCTVAALALLVHGFTVLGRVSGHRPPSACTPLA